MDIQFPHRKLIRLKQYDYSKEGYYFITICTKNKKNWFGKIIDNKMILNECGRIAKDLWEETPKHFKNIQLDEFIIMPNHIHGIIILKNDTVENRHACSLPTKRQYQKLPIIIGSYKSAVTRNINKIYKTNFQWQKSFYEHIIWYEEELPNIQEYIINNPLQWELDIENPYKIRK